jgi:hypothetical protein
MLDPHSLTVLNLFAVWWCAQKQKTTEKGANTQLWVIVAALLAVLLAVYFAVQ